MSATSKAAHPDDAQARERLEPIERVLLTQAEAAAAVGMSAAQFGRLSREGRVPQPVKFSNKTLLWSAKGLAQWAEDLDRKAQRLANRAS